MSKVKRISLIAKGKNFFSELIGIKERKIRNAVDAAINKAMEEKILASDAATQALISLGENDDPHHYSNCIKTYVDSRAAEEEWSKNLRYAEELKARLEEEVETPKEEK